MDERPLGVWDLVILCLSVWVLAALMIEVAFPISDAASAIIQKLDTLVCVVFVADFAVGLARAPDKARFMKWGWIDLVGSIPMIDWSRWLRMVRVVRILRVLRAVRSARAIARVLMASRTRTAAASLVVAMLAVFFVASMSILVFEKATGSTIKSAADAAWWTITTMSTVGYGDTYPVTPEGRILAAVVMVFGVALFGTLSGLTASWFLGEDRTQYREQLERLAAELRAIRARLDSHGPQAPAQQRQVDKED
ncbi:MAG TPA: ion transporter [Verrucomicrobiae bacterium]|nr:ion transporter [Verrucomicrobiae bacterium]